MLSPEERYHREYQEYVHRTQYITDALADIEIRHFRKMVLNTVTGEVEFIDNYSEADRLLRNQILELHRIVWKKFHDKHVTKRLIL